MKAKPILFVKKTGMLIINDSKTKDPGDKIQYTASKKMKISINLSFEKKALQHFFGSRSKGVMNNLISAGENREKTKWSDSDIAPRLIGSALELCFSI